MTVHLGVPWESLAGAPSQTDDCVVVLISAAGRSASLLSAPVQAKGSAPDFERQTHEARKLKELALLGVLGALVVNYLRR
jgi:hypothetical protein